MAKSPELQVNQDLDFQRREWQVQRIGWWLLTAFVAAAALGVFGGGLLSHAHAATPDASLSVDYERFIRARASTRLTIRVERPGPIELRLTRAWFDRFRLERLTPEPSSLQVSEHEAVLRFDAAAPFTLFIDATPLEAGWHQAEISMSGGPSLSFGQLTYY